MYVEGDDARERLGISIENAFFRIAQEALTNVAKHSDASRVDIHLDTENGHTRLTIVDNGRGFIKTDFPEDNRSETWGLSAMNERALRIGGRFHIDSRTGKGTRVVVEVEQ